jgi:hypothetical protein
VHINLIIHIERDMKGCRDRHPGESELLFMAAECNAYLPEQFPLGDLKIPKYRGIVNATGGIGIDPTDS